MWEFLLVLGHEIQNDFYCKVNPDDIVVDGWDINSANMAEAVERAQVLEPALQQQLRSQLALLKPRASIYDPDFIAANQADRANNVIKGSKAEQVRRIFLFNKTFKATLSLFVCKNT